MSFGHQTLYNGGMVTQRRFMGNNLLAARTLHGESVRQVAAAVGIDHAAYVRLENGERGCSDQTKLALAEHFGVPVARLFFQRTVSKRNQEDAS